MRLSQGHTIREYIVSPILTTPTGDCIATLSTTSFTPDAALYEIQRMKRFGLIDGEIIDVAYYHSTDKYIMRVA